MLTFLYTICYLFVFVVGLCVGSFLNVLAYRIPNRIDFVRGRSFCPGCNHSLSAKDLVPLFSWLFLGGKCRYCGRPISRRYPLVELAGGFLAALSCWRMGFTVQAGIAFLASCVLLTIALIDGDTQQIPDGLNIALAALAAASFFVDQTPTLAERLIGGVCVSVPMLLMNLAVPTSFGGGDIKLMAAAGLLLGWKMTLLAMFLAVLAGGGYGAALLIRRKKGRKDHFAFGPFLSGGCVLALYFGSPLLGWYLGLF